MKVGVDFENPEIHYENFKLKNEIGGIKNHAAIKYNIGYHQIHQSQNDLKTVQRKIKLQKQALREKKKDLKRLSQDAEIKKKIAELAF